MFFMKTLQHEEGSLIYIAFLINDEIYLHRLTCIYIYTHISSP